MWGFVDLYTNQAQAENLAMSIILESATEATYIIEVGDTLKAEK